jgi:hypothetical protein
VTSQQISIAIEATPVLSYAMAHNEIPAISRLTIDGVGADVRAATLRLAVADAEGPIGAPQEVLLDLAGGEPTVLTDLTLVLDPAAMLRVEEQRPGTIRAELLVAGEVVAEQVVRTRVLAANQWLATPPALALELLAAYVLPNHPAVDALLADVAERLRAGTGSPSIQGYQAGPERVDLIVAAVFAAMQARGIRYAGPPASWADTGQKVRTPGEVLEHRVGTCLDLVVTMAAALELAGIRPLLWLVPGHAFLGWWREESSLGSVVEFDPAGVANRLDLGQLGVVETTAVTGPVGFGEASRSVRAEHLAGELHVLGIVDVRQARADRIVPLPARTRGPDGAVQVFVYQPAALPAAPEATPPAAGAGGSHAVPEPARVARWKNALLDLSLRNRLINLSARSGLSVAVPDAGPGTLEDLLHRGVAITLRPSDDLAATDLERGLRHGRDLPTTQLAELLQARHAAHVDVPAAAYPTRLRSLAYKARTILEETGANNLYLSLGTLVWELDGRPLRSPLILVPVRLRAAARGGRYRLTLDETGSSTPNYCLLEKLRQLHGLDVPGLADPASDEAGIDLDAAFAAVRRSIAEHSLPYRVEPTADLGILQFAKFRLWKDLDENWSAFAANPLVDHLVRTPTDAFADPAPEVPIPDLEALDEGCPVPADSSQLRAVAEAVAGRTFVLEGPPGTGKSQTITNLLARAIAEGQQVLFVAEKRAALDVVQRRLEAVGLGPLSLDLHDKASKPAAVREQIARAFEHLVPADPREHEIRTEELRAARRVLTRYAYRLHEGNAAGLSLYGAHGAVLGAPDVPALPLPESLLAGTPGEVDRLRHVLSTLPEVAEAARPEPGHPWAFVDRVAVDVAAVQAAGRRLDAALPALPAALRPALDAAEVPADLAALAGLLEAGHPLAVLDEVRTPRWDSAVRSVVAEAEAFAATPHPGLDVVTPAVLDLPVEEIDVAARAAAGAGFFGRRKRLKAVRDRLAPALRPEARVRPKAVPELTARLVRLRQAVHALAGSVTAIPGLTLPPGWNPFSGRDELVRRIEDVRRAGARVEPAARLAGPLRAALAVGAGTDPRPVREAATAAEDLLAACGAEPAALAGWAAGAGLLRRWTGTAAGRALGDPELGSLRRWLDLLRHLEPLRSAGLDEARAAVLDGWLDPDDARLAYEAGLAETSVVERLRRTGLDRFDRPAHERSVARFVTAARGVRGHLTTVIPRQVLDARGFDPAASGGRVGELQRQLTRRRGGLRIRELMSAYGDVITRALPCVLVSPESLARFFPARAGLFDIVVFDEASQVRVADAIGAMGRARSVVVVGDSKQMPPTSVAESSFAEDLDAESALEAVEDEESILTECVQARVQRHRLGWHYRSQDETLIAFSNHHYYDGALATFPAPASAGTGVSMVRVDGRFHRSGPRETFRTNPVEAEAVVAEIRRRFAASPDRAPSVGVVTFNLQQRAYIEGLLRDAGDQRLLDALEDPDGLFVKNLENVQGDERDVVLFSTAFSVDVRGVLPLNFGPLNRAGGERRLNVAVTRARRQVIVFSSFDPEQLRTGETSSVGVRHLRSYLELAAHGPAVLPRDGRRRSEPDRHREDVAGRLRDRGVPVRTDVGLSDFALDLVLGEPADPRVAVLLDGRAWSRRMTARDRDALPREVLADVLGWPAVERVWLPDWLADRDAVLDRLAGALTRPGPQPALSEPEPPAAALEPEPPAAAPDPPVAALPPPDEETFVPWPVRALGSVEVLDALPAPAAARRVAAALAEVVEAEGPVPVDRLGRLVATGFGLTRVTEARKAAILRHLPGSVVRDEAEPVVWPSGRTPAGWIGFRRTPEGTDRPLEHVPLREIVNAMASITRASAGADRDELRRLVLAVFGGRRLTASIADRLDAALDLGIRSGRLTVEAGTVSPGGPDTVPGMRGNGGRTAR